ncbi:zinc-dependent alcohol dehydrogenase [Paenibacillus eucommiae]|uniref:Threonine dehydrogenase-like Zn-dependent dehydrogenase n=1 Tax=Paenibacillus eucommiae TaxID=1355755 RepID=A0ABS4J4R4_9BACL|nr:zinc-binding alcohol dehydrogenase [Paenibacillus eucommiae]MBP1993779.1 threonine dehydrogenase-like Zn-dependent dehydrogenase [Paenibacillus eucommiae]
MLVRRLMTVDGKVVLAEAPEAELPAGFVRVRTLFSAVSPGTELAAIRERAEQPAALGYSASGIIVELGEGVRGFYVGQRIACYGAPYVAHATQLNVPVNLVAAVPDHVFMEEAAFAGLGAIAIHALRTADLRFGESILVIGLGMIGQLIAQIAHAAAYSIVSFERDEQRAARFREYGIGQVYSERSALEQGIATVTGGHGVDSVLLSIGGSSDTDENTDTDKQTWIDHALHWIRDRGTIVVVGGLDTSFSRELMFSKEAKVLISRAGGPGRYDEAYERYSRDYPLGYVRWTEGRNIAEYIRLLSDQRIAVKSLITHKVPMEQAEWAYGNYQSSELVMGTLFTY